jgi:hypothetical protein
MDADESCRDVPWGGLDLRSGPCIQLGDEHVGDVAVLVPLIKAGMHFAAVDKECRRIRKIRHIFASSIDLSLKPPAHVCMA